MYALVDGNNFYVSCERAFRPDLVGRPVSDLNEAMTHFASRAAEKLRKQGSTAQQLMCFIRTSPFRPDPQYSRSVCMPLRRPTADTATLVTAALAGLKAIYQPGFNYAKAGVMLMDLQAETVHQGELVFDDGRDIGGRSALMATLDELNQRFGRGTVLMASAGLAGERRALLGSMYWRGDEQWRDVVLAYAWTNIAAANGDDHSAQQRDFFEEALFVNGQGRVERSMSSSEILEAQRISSNWKIGEIIVRKKISSAANLVPSRKP